MSFEKVKTDRCTAIQHMVAFLNAPLTPDRLDRILMATSLAALKAINHQVCPARRGAFTDPKGEIIRQGKLCGAQRLFSTWVLRRFDAHWIEGSAALKSDFPFAARYGWCNGRDAWGGMHGAGCKGRSGHENA